MTVGQQQYLLAYLGYYTASCDGIRGPETEAAFRAFQEAFGGIRVDGICGRETEKALKHAIVYGTLKRQDLPVEQEKTETFWEEIQFFSRDEPCIACSCGKCGGFPVEPSRKLMQLADKVRRQAGRAMIPTSTVRCKAHNAAVGGVKNSRHLLGTAMDFYIPGWNAEKTLALVRQQPEVAYAYAIDAGAVHMDVVE